MARSNRSTSSSSRRNARNTASTTTSTGEKVYNRTRKITNYTFMYQRDRVSRQAGSSGFAIASNADDSTLMMTLQEAKSLYNFLHNALNNN